MNAVKHFLFILTLSLFSFKPVHSISVLSIPGVDKAAIYVAGGIAEIMTKQLTSGKIIKTKHLCKKGNLSGLTSFYKVRSVKDATKLLKDSIAIRSGNGVIAKGSKTLGAFGLLTCAGVGDFDQSKFAKEAKSKIKKAYGATDEKTLKKVVSTGILKLASGGTKLICTAIGAGLVATEVGLAAIPAVASTCGPIINSLDGAVKRNQGKLSN